MSGQKRITGVHHLAFITNDLDRTVKFWRDLLELPLVHTHGHPGYRQYYFAIGKSELVTFFEWPDVERVDYRRHGDPITGKAIFDHVSFSVRDEAALWALSDILVSAEQPVTEMVDHGFFRSIYSYDPNGIPIEFSLERTDINVRKNPVLKDLKPPKVRLEGTNPKTERWPEVDASTPDEQIVLLGDGNDLFPPWK
ncbi:MAG: VOC family protein [Magnetococcales bacterium]|nr:VOC family protein [Magnetococcales bacterium]